MVSADVWAAIESGLTCDITTTGRRSGEPKRVEIWYFVVDGAIYLTGTPGPRDWLANLRSDDEMTLHVKEGATADLPARGVEITDTDERRRLMIAVREAMSWYVEQGHELDEWIADSPLVRVDLVG